MRQRFSVARLLASSSLVAVLAAGLGGCQTMADITGSVAPRAEAIPTDPARAVDMYGERYRSNPKDVDAAFAYGQALRANGQRAQAAAVLEQATIAHPGNKQLLGRRTRPTTLIGACSRYRAPALTRWAGTTRRAATTPAR
jgi:Flp pilus assembly protein TadD